MRRRVWCETLPYEELCAPSVLALLARFGVDVLLAVRPWHAKELPEVHARLAGEGIHVGVWPMLENERGRWASVHSHAAFVQFTNELLALAPSVPEVVIDLEPAFADLERWKSWRPSWGKRATEPVKGGVHGRGAQGRGADSSVSAGVVATTTERTS